MRLNEISNVFSDITLDWFINWDGVGLLIDVTGTDLPTAQPKLGFTMRLDTDNWRHLWSIKEFQDEFRIIASSRDIPARRSDKALRGVRVSFDIENLDFQIESEISRFLPIVKDLYDSTIASLSAKVREHAVVMFFDFPEPVKIPCQQYLLYFVQFLKDVGVDATAELEEQAGRVLFAVTPKDENVALEKVRQALDIYLRLPTSPSTDLVPQGAGVEVQRIIAQVHHLKGQLVLAAATLQQKDMLIQQQQTFIDQQLLTGQVLISSVRTSEPATDPDSEPLINGIVTVKPYESHGVEINLPELLRRLKRLFSGPNQE
jgi:hypothetical protein